MPSPRENIELYLRDFKVAEGHQLPAAILFTDSMLRELAAAVAEWEEMAATLQRMRREMKSPCLN